MVYHYTSPEGLFEIIKKQNVRFTDCQYMNDKSEFMYIREPLLKALRKCEGELKFKHYSELIDKEILVNYGERTTEYIPPKAGSTNGHLQTSDKRHYVFCTSKSDDSLGMWHYYTKGKNYQGYNIGFDEKKLVKDVVEKSSGAYNYTFKHFKIIYNEQNQIDMLVKFLRKVDEDIVKWCKNKKGEINRYDGDSISRMVLSGSLDYSKYQLMFKHPAYADEKEYRFVLSISDAKIDEFSETFKKDYFIRNGIITPCCTMSFDRGSINNITVSPTMELKLVQYSTDKLLIENGYSKRIEIKQSEIPVRF